MREMIPIFANAHVSTLALWAATALAGNPPDLAAQSAPAQTSRAPTSVQTAAAPTGQTPASPVAATTSPSAPAAGSAGAPVQKGDVSCLSSGDGYLRAKVAGAIEARLDWPNSGTRCQGESREKPPGVRLSFQRASGAVPDLLLVFGLTGVREGQSAHEVKANLTVIVQGTSRIFGTLGDSRCTVDSLSQRPLEQAGSYRLEARGFCTQPAHAVRGRGDVLVSTFEFAGPVAYFDQKN